MPGPRTYKGYKYARTDRGILEPLALPKPRRAVRLVKPKKRRRPRFLSFPPKANINQKAFYKLTYADSVALTTSTTSSGEYVFRMNSIYDCDFTSSGHQPYGYDQLAALWTRYRVHKCLVEVTGHTLAANNGYTFYIRAGDSVAASTSLTSQIIREAGLAEVVKEIAPLHTAVGAGRQFFARKMFKTKKFASAGLNDTTNYAAAFGANPVDSIFIALGQCSDTTTAFTVYCHVKLTYYFDVTEPIILSQS